MAKKPKSTPTPRNKKFLNDLREAIRLVTHLMTDIHHQRTLLLQTLYPPPRCHQEAPPDIQTMDHAVGLLTRIMHELLTHYSNALSKR